MMGVIREADEAMSGALHRCELGALDNVFVITGLCFGSRGMPFTLAIIWFFLGNRAGFAAIFSCILTVAITETLKKQFGRDRPHPKDIAQRRFNLRGMLTNHAFPSGDSAQVW